MLRQQASVEQSRCYGSPRSRAARTWSVVAESHRRTRSAGNRIVRFSAPVAGRPRGRLGASTTERITPVCESAHIANQQAVSLGCVKGFIGVFDARNCAIFGKLDRIGVEVGFGIDQGDNGGFVGHGNSPAKIEGNESVSPLSGVSGNALAPTVVGHAADASRRGTVVGANGRCGGFGCVMLGNHRRRSFLANQGDNFGARELATATSKLAVVSALVPDGFDIDGHFLSPPRGISASLDLNYRPAFNTSTVIFRQTINKSHNGRQG